MMEMSNTKHRSLLTCKAWAVISITGVVGSGLSYNEAFNVAKTHRSSFIVTREVVDRMIAGKTTLSPPRGNSLADSEVLR